jgi:omega-6 fatty acid desaturase (delta-12 desaturase)
MTTEEHVYRHINKYVKSNDLKASQYFLFTLAGYIGGFYLPWWCFPLHTLFFVRLFMCLHDMGHGYFFKTKFLNRAVGTVCGALTSTSFQQWNETHNEHHKISNDLNYTQYAQTAVFTVSEFNKLSPFYQSAYKRLTTNRFLLLTAVPIYLGIVNPIVRAKNKYEKLLLLSYLWFLFQSNMLARYYTCILFGELIGFIFFHSQHTFDAAKRRKDMTHFDSAMEGASYLQIPNYLKWATGAIEYHHIHHLSVAVPLYNLQRCHEEAPPDMFEHVKRITLCEGFEALKYTLYDEKNDRLVSFDQPGTFN